MSNTVPSILTTTVKVTFDADNSAHRQSYAAFRVANVWGPTGCPFKLDWPFVSVPAMCQERVLQWYLNSDTLLVA